MSYLDNVDFGFLACGELVPDLDDLAACVPDALAELRKAADHLDDRAQQRLPDGA
ncbi:MAG: WSD1 family O-acyltransferase [Acidimicrobiia bacterium]|nr:WSD1 family O-acyltransferase [Acidimicrobiia bacterium]